MKWLYRHLYRKEKGFTLVELMIVIIILAILTGIAVPSYMVLRTRARTSAAKAEMKNIATALEMYNADYEVYPLTADYPDDLVMGPGATGIDAVAYMDPVPITDGWGDDYGYVSAGATYTLSCNAGTAAAVLNITDGQADW